MLVNKRLTPVIRTIAGTVACVFLWLQIAWAGDLIDYSIDKLNAEQSQTFAPAYLQDQQAMHEELISQKQAIEDGAALQTLTQDTLASDSADSSSDVASIELQGPTGGEGVISMALEGAAIPLLASVENLSSGQSSALSLTTEAGDVIYYIGNTIDRIERADGTILRNIILDANNNLQDADIIYADNTIESVVNKKVIKITKSDGTIFNYDPDETISSVEYPDGKIIVYSYIRSDTGTILETILTDTEKIAHYDSNNRIKKVEFNSGKVVDYESGILSRIRDTDGKIYVFEGTGSAADYTVKLKNVEFEDKNITDPIVDSEGKLVSGIVLYSDGIQAAVENKRLKQVTELDGTKITYQYSQDSLSCDVTIESGGNVRSFKYLKEASTGRFLIKDGASTYQYDPSWRLEKFDNEFGSISHSYDNALLYAGSIFTLTSGIIKKYDGYKNLSETLFPNGTLYDYILGESRNITISKKSLYNGNNVYQSYYSNQPVGYTANPSFKTFFALDGSKTYSSAYISASSYTANDKSVSLTLNIYNQKGRISYYLYDYKTRQTVSDNKELNMAFAKNTAYTVEYVWVQSGIDVYVYESSVSRPSAPVYTIANNQWDPRFSVSGNNAGISIDPASSGTYSASKSVSTDYNSPLKGGALYNSEFKFDGAAAGQSLSLYVSGRTAASNDSISFSYYNNKPALNIYRYDIKTGQSTSTSIPLNLTLNISTTYVLQVKLENSALKLYINEKFAPQAGPVYTMENVTWDPQISMNINKGELNVEAYNKLEEYTYSAGDGKIAQYKRSEDRSVLTYIYDATGGITAKELTLPNGTIKTYDKYNKLLREEGPGREVMIYGYDTAGKLISITPQFPVGTVTVYYESGQFQGRIKTATLVTGNTIHYDYKLTAAGDLQVYRRSSYSGNNRYQSYYSNAQIDRSLNPTLKTLFKLDGAKTYPSVYLSANYYAYGDRSVSLSLNVSGAKPYIYYYYYDYKTGQSIYDRKELNVPVNKDVEYTAEYVWSSGGVNIYLYESTRGRPEAAIYTIANAQWNPKFNVSGNNANIGIDPSSSGAYSRNASISTDYNDPLGSGPLYNTEFKFDPDGANRSLYYTINGRSALSSDSIYFRYYNGAPSLNISHYDYATRQSTNTTVPVNITINPGTTYIAETKVEEGALKLYLFEKGQSSDVPIYTMANVSWAPQIYTSVNGGTLNVESYDHLQVYGYGNNRGLILENDVDAALASTGFITNDPWRTIPGYMLDPGAPLAFPEESFDIITKKRFDLNIFIAQPQSEYFDTIKYGQDGVVKEVLKSDGSRITYENGLISNVLADGKQMLYRYDISQLGNIGSIDISRDGLTRRYNERGELESLTTQGNDRLNYINGSLDSLITADGKKYLYAGGLLSEFIDKDGTAFTFGDDGKIATAKDIYGREFRYSYMVDPYDYKDTVLIEDMQTGTLRTYKNELLVRTEETYGLRAENIYDINNRLSVVEIKLRGSLVEKYIYTYKNPVTEVADLEGNVRSYDESGKLRILFDKNKYIYRYSYPDPITTTVELVGRQIDNVNISYDKWNIESIKIENGLTYNELVMDEGLKRLQFNSVAEDGFTESITVSGAFKNVLTKNGVNLLYGEDALLAIATSQGAVYYADKQSLAALAGTMPQDFAKKYFLSEYTGNGAIYPKFTSQPWQLQGYWNTLAFQSIRNDAENDQLVIGSHIIAGNETISQGEIYLNVGSYKPSYYLDSPADPNNYDPMNLTGKEISFLVKLPEGSFNGNGRPLYLQAFAKGGGNWNSQYGVPVSITEDGKWYRVSMRPSAENIDCGLTSGSFDPTQVSLIGFKLWAASDSGIEYTGDVIVKSGLNIDLPPEETYQDSPVLINLSDAKRYIKNITNSSVVLGVEKNYVNISDVSLLFNGTGPADNSNVSMDTARWHTQNYQDSRSVRSVVRDDANDQWLAHANFSSENSYRQGEMILDLRYDVPGLKWQGPIDLEGKTLKFKIKVPPGTALDPNKPISAQLFVKDRGYTWQSGARVDIGQSDVWYEKSVTPSSYPGFDATSIMEMGIKFWTNVPINFDGELMVKHLLAPDIFKTTDLDGVALDGLALKKYMDESGIIPDIDASVITKSDFIKNRISDYMLDDENDIIAQEFKNGKLTKLERGNKTITTFTGNGDIDYISDISGRLLIDYDYDGAGNFTGITYVDARRRLDNSVEDSLRNVYDEKARAMENLIAQKGIVYSQIRDQIAPNFSELYQQRQQLINAWNSENDRWVWFWDKKAKSERLDSIGRAINEVDRAIANVNQSLSAAYSELDSEAAALADSIDNEAASAIQQINTEKSKLLLEILKEENSLIIVNYYRSLLGRDPDDAELAGALANISIDQQKIDAQALRESILSGSEYNERKAQIEAVTSSVKTALEAFLIKSDPEKEIYLNSLGLTLNETVDLHAYDVQEIVKWLEGQSMHFGYSAFLSLKDIFPSDTTVPLETIAAESILIDIFTGVTDIFTEGDLLISMNAMQTTAAAHNIDVWSVKLDFTDLASQTAPAIIHTTGKHYVVVERVVNDIVYFKENSKGASGTEEEMSKDEFLKLWDGYSITKEAPQDPAKIISVEEAKKVKGAVLEWIGFFIAALITAATSVISAVVATIGTILATVATVVAQAIAGIAGVIGSIGSFLTANIGATFAGLSAISGMGGLAGGIFNTVVAVGLNFGLSTALNALGVDHNIASLTSAFLTGGVTGLLTGGLNFMSFTAGALKYATVEGINIASASLNLNQNLASIISLTSGALVDGMFKGNIFGTFQTIAPNIASEVAYFGIQEAGNLLGIDSRISYLAGIGIRSMISPGVDMYGRPLDIWQGITNGLLQGVANISINYATQELGLNPLLANIGFSAIAGTINAGIQASTGRDADIFANLFETYKQSALVFFGAGNAWQQTAYIAQILDFSNIIKEQGLVEALNLYTTSFFNAVTTNAITESGKTIGGYLKDKLDANDYALRTMADGKILKAVEIKDAQGNVVGTAFFEDKPNGAQFFSDFAGLEWANAEDGSMVIGWGDIGIDTFGKMGYKDADIYRIFDSDIQFQRIEDGLQTYAEVKDSLGNVLLVIEPIEGGGYNVYNSIGEYHTAKILDLLSDQIFSFDDSEIDGYSLLDSLDEEILLNLDFSDPATINLLLGDPDISPGEIGSLNLNQIDRERALRYILVNGINNKNPNGISPGYMRGITEQLALADPNMENSLFIPLYENGGLIKDGWKWLNEVYLRSDAVTDQIIAEWDAKFGSSSPQDLVGITFSGGGDPFIQALNKRPNIDMKSLVFFGSPLKYGRQITNPNVENVISIEGGIDPVVALFGGYFWSFEENPRPLNLFRIVLDGVDHFHYSYDPDPTKHDQGPLKIKSAKFISKVTQYANDTSALTAFLRNTNGINYDNVRKIYFVNLDEVTYGQ